MKINVNEMSIKDMERMIFDIMTSNGASKEEANQTINTMSVTDMEKYLKSAED